VTLIQGDHMIKQIASATSHSALCHTILPRAFERSSDRRKLHCRHGCKDFIAKLGVPIKDQELVHMLRREGFSHLLCNPKMSRVSGDIEVEDAPTIMRDDEKQYSTLKLSVGTVKKSIAAIASRWLIKNAFQSLLLSGFFGARRIQRETVRSDKSNPSFSSSP